LLPMKELKLTQGYVALVDDEDYERCLQHRWRVSHQKHRGLKSSYAQANFGYPKETTLMLHRFILSAPKESHVDHIDRNGLNNQKINLRLCTASQNQGNRAPHNGNALKWIQKTDSGKFSVCVKGKRIGTFNLVNDAILAANFAAKEAYGDFAYQNPISTTHESTTPPTPRATRLPVPRSTRRDQHQRRELYHG